VAVGAAALFVDTSRGCVVGHRGTVSRLLPCPAIRRYISCSARWALHWPCSDLGRGPWMPVYSDGNAFRFRSVSSVSPEAWPR
jgi:hypothetical protein